MPIRTELSPLNLFYEEPDVDRWLAYDRYPRALIRRLIRGKPSPSGHRRVFLNLCAGLQRLGVDFRINDYRFARQNPGSLACIVGKPCVLAKMEWRNPILLGAAIHSHPVDDLNLLKRMPIKKVLVPGPWMKAMFESVWGDVVQSWPVGIDTDLWAPGMVKDTDLLIYDKVRWHHDHFEASLIAPIRAQLRQRNLSFQEIRYGHYREEEFRSALSSCRAMIFLCEHETQGIAYQQALSSGVPIFAWDRGGFWQDPNYYPHRVAFEPVTSVPYWDRRCGMRFKDFCEFETSLADFWSGIVQNTFEPRNYILENLTLEGAAREYLKIVEEVQACL